MYKQDILDLGWIQPHPGFWYEWPVKETLYCDELSSRPLDWRLNWVEDGRALHIDFYERNVFDWLRAYEGPGDIEKLKMLMQWLKISPPQE